jgi:ribosomal protein L18
MRGCLPTPAAFDSRANSAIRSSAGQGTMRKSRHRLSLATNAKRVYAQIMPNQENDRRAWFNSVEACLRALRMKRMVAFVEKAGRDLGIEPGSDSIRTDRALPRGVAPGAMLFG